MNRFRMADKYHIGNSVDIAHWYRLCEMDIGQRTLFPDISVEFYKMCQKKKQEKKAATHFQCVYK